MNRHLSEEEICRAIACQPTIEERRHLDACAACRAEVDRSRHAFGALRRAVVEWADRQVPASTRSFDARPSTGLTWQRALAAAALVGVFVLVFAGVRRAGLPGSGGTAHPDATASGDRGDLGAVVAAGEFFPLTYSSVPVTNGRVLRLEVPSSAVAAFGLDPADVVGTRPDAVLADVVVGEDGLARAVRFVRAHGDEISTRKENTP